MSSLSRRLAHFEEPVYAILRVVAGLMFSLHGMQKLFGWIGAEGTEAVGSQMWIGGVIELSCGLLIASGLMIKSVANIRTIDLGYKPDGVFTARLGFPEGYTDTVSQMQFFEQLQQKVSAIPGVTIASISGGRSVSWSAWASAPAPSGTEGSEPSTTRCRQA